MLLAPRAAAGQRAPRRGAGASVAARAALRAALPSRRLANIRRSRIRREPAGQPLLPASARRDGVAGERRRWCSPAWRARASAGGYALAAAAAAAAVAAPTAAVECGLICLLLVACGVAKYWPFSVVTWCIGAGGLMQVLFRLVVRYERWRGSRRRPSPRYGRVLTREPGAPPPRPPLCERSRARPSACRRRSGRSAWRPTRPRTPGCSRSCWRRSPR